LSSTRTINMRALAAAAIAGATVAAASSASPPQSKLALNMSNVVQAFGVLFYPPSNATAVLDEQTLAGDPAAGSGGVPKVAYEPTWDATYYGPQVKPYFFIDLGSRTALTSVWVYRGWGHFNLSVEVTDVPADPTRAAAAWVWDFGGADPAGQGWVSHNFSSPFPTGRFLHVTSGAPSGSSLLELVLYGAPSSADDAAVAPTAPLPNPAPLPVPPFGALMGTNGFQLAGMENLTGIVGAFREYSDWDWSEHGGPDLNEFQPTGDVDFFTDSFYGNLTARGILGHHCVQKSPSWLHNGTSADMAWKPLTLDQLAIPNAAMNASYYGVIAAHVYQLAARYGKTPVPLANLRLAPGQPQATALGTMTGVEVFNEVDGTWNGGRNGYFASYEYAAMLSAAYDGHEGSLGPLMGAKQADPGFPVVHSGLAGLDLAPEYFEGVRQWALAYRADGKFPADALNVHSYCRDPTGTHGVAPENCTVEADLARICLWRDTYAPTLPLYFSEWGYDTVGGPSVAPPVGAFSQQEVQAMWLIRSLLLIARVTSPLSGGPCVSRSHMYMLADVESTSGGVFATSGLLASSDFGYATKVSFWFYSAFFKALGNFTSVGLVAVPGAPPSVYAQCFALPGSASPPVFALVVWSGTSAGTEVQGVAVPVTAAGGCAVAGAGTASLTVLTPAANSVNGNATSVAVGAAGTVTMTVTEIPVILLL
jgi:hypothetical protein